VAVKDIRSGYYGSYPRYLTDANGRLFFVADDGTHGSELWATDGTAAGTAIVKDIRAGSGNSYPADLTNLNGTLLFRANNGTNGYELWKSDGTSSGTALVKDIRSGSSNSYPDVATVDRALEPFAAGLRPDWWLR
jgi:ELWxxDGT repeat protein